MSSKRNITECQKNSRLTVGCNIYQLNLQKGSCLLPNIDNAVDKETHRMKGGWWCKACALTAVRLSLCLI